MTERYLKAEKCSCKERYPAEVRGSGSSGPLTEVAGRWWSSQNDFRVVLWEQQSDTSLSSSCPDFDSREQNGSLLVYKIFIGIL